LQRKRNYQEPKYPGLHATVRRVSYLLLTSRGTFTNNTRLQSEALKIRNLVASGIMLSKNPTKRTTPTVSWWHLVTVKNGNFDTIEPTEPE
jgi:hypothetical protein